jgi:hypothetical protein
MTTEQIKTEIQRILEDVRRNNESVKNKIGMLQSLINESNESKEVRMPDFLDVVVMIMESENARITLSKNYNKQLNILDTLLCARDWVWDNMEDGYRPDWTDDTTKYAISNFKGELGLEDFVMYWKTFSFKTKKTAEMFLEKYRSQLEEIKELL